METNKPFLNIIIAMDERNSIGHDKRIPWAPIPTDQQWLKAHSTFTKDPSKRVALILGRNTFDEVTQFFQEYLSRWHFIVITRQIPDILYNTYSIIDKKHVDIVDSFDQAAHRARILLDTPSAMIESVFVFGGVRPYEEALASKLVKRIYLTRIFAEIPECDTRLSQFDLNDFQRIKRPDDEILTELDDKIIEENGWKYQFQIYEQKTT